MGMDFPGGVTPIVREQLQIARFRKSCELVAARDAQVRDGNLEETLRGSESWRESSHRYSSASFTD
jgi:hypothetical protein